MMLNLYSIAVKNEFPEKSLTDGERYSVLYHDIFDFPLTFTDMIRWRASDKAGIPAAEVSIREGHAFIEGREGLVYKRALRKRISLKKLEKAKKAAKILNFLPSIRMVGITGSLAMENSSEGSDIDFLIVTSHGTLWLTRIMTVLTLKVLGIPVRLSGDKKEKDKICMNMWMDEGDLVWKTHRNFYTAHEIAQVKPLINKNKTFERFIYTNRWVQDYWPNSVTTRKSYKRSKGFTTNVVLRLIENAAYKIQYKHMVGKITREIVTPTRALFHPQDWGKIVLSRLAS